MLYSFPPNDFAEIERGYEQFAERWGPILDVFDQEGVRFGLEVHPTEIAYDFVTTAKALAAIGQREAFGINLDPSHFAHQFLDPAAFALEFADRIYHVHVKDSQAAARRPALDPRLAPELRRGGAGLGLRLAGPRRRRLRGVLARAEPDRLHRARCRSSGRTRGWTASTARATRSRSCGGSTSRRPTSRSTRRCSGRMSEPGRPAAAGGRRQTIGVGMLGYAFMGRAHANAYRTLAYMPWPPPLRPRLVSIAGRDEEAVAAAARRYGFARSRDRLARARRRPGVELFDNCGPNAFTPSRRSPPPRPAST